jgi:colicin import membrane protein
MPRPTARVERASDRWASIALSVLLHGGLVAAFAYGWWTYKRDRPQPTLAIEASVVDARTVPGLNRQQPTPDSTPPPPAPPPETPPPPQESEGPPEPTPEELAKREQEQKAEADREAQAKQQADDQKRQEQERQQEQALAEEKAAQQKRDEEQRQAQAEEQKKAQEKAEADRRAKEAADAKKKADDQKRLEAEKKAQAEADAQRQAELQQSLNQEMQRDSARTSTAMTTWVGQITRKIQDSWLRPPSARAGIVCELTVTQVPGGEVTNARVGSCNGDAVVKQSIVDAAYRASPLPPPPDPTLFERTLIITFRPD